MNNKPVLPTTKTGKAAVITLLVAFLLMVAGTASSFIVRVDSENEAINPFGLLVPAFLLATVVGVALSWIAIARKDRARLLLIVAIVATAGIVLVIVFETIEAISMSM